MKVLEIEAMKAISDALETLAGDDTGAIHRVLAWATSAYGYTPPKTARGGQGSDSASAQSNGVGTESGQSKVAEYGDVADLFSAAAPRLEFEKALVIGYWIQVKEGRPGFGGQEVNGILKNLGHRILNITDAFNSAMRQKPQLVVQTAKSGSAKQARKTYKLTHAGIKWMESRLTDTASQGDSGDA